ncbi:MAG TPA: hypothetical protein IAB23_09615 [Candidatus Scybalocola faecavium]|nr:hypothetical protein [Candidatus Scybalocola faecavium]
MKYQKSRSTLFLMELMIAIFFFAVTGAVCVRVFSSAHLLDRQTTALNHAVAQAESMAEVFKASDGHMSVIRELYPDIVLFDENTGEIYYDRTWKTVSAPDAYRLTLTLLPEESGCAKACIRIFTEGQADPIYELEVKKFVKGTLP